MIMNNAAFLPLPKDVKDAVGISAFVGMFSGFALTHTLQGAVLGALGAPIGVAMVVGLFVGGFYLWEDFIPKVSRKFKYRHLKVGALVSITDNLMPGICVAAPRKYLDSRGKSTHGTITGRGDTVLIVDHGNGTVAAYNPEELTFILNY